MQPRNGCWIWHARFHRALSSVHLRGAADWIVSRNVAHRDCVRLLGIDSPGLTGSLAIGRQVRGILAAQSHFRARRRGNGTPIVGSRCGKTISTLLLAFESWRRFCRPLHSPIACQGA